MRLNFPYKESHATLILGGWGGSLIGISSIDDFDASENETGDAYIFEDNQWYDIRLRVTDSEISVWINDEQVIDCEVEGRKVAMRFGEIEMSVPLGNMHLCNHWSYSGSVFKGNLKQLLRFLILWFGRILQFPLVSTVHRQRRYRVLFPFARLPWVLSLFQLGSEKP